MQIHEGNSSYATFKKNDRVFGDHYEAKRQSYKTENRDQSQISSFPFVSSESVLKFNQSDR